MFRAKNAGREVMSGLNSASSLSGYEKSDKSLNLFEADDTSHVQ